MALRWIFSIPLCFFPFFLFWTRNSHHTNSPPVFDFSFTRCCDVIFICTTVFLCLKNRVWCTPVYRLYIQAGLNAHTCTKSQVYLKVRHQYKTHRYKSRMEAASLFKLFSLTSWFSAQARTGVENKRLQRWRWQSERSDMLTLKVKT